MTGSLQPDGFLLQSGVLHGRPHMGAQVFLEFDVNDNVQTPYMNNGHRRSLEVLLRKLLQFPNRPAMVYLHWWSPSLNQGQRSFWRAPAPPCPGGCTRTRRMPFQLCAGAKERGTEHVACQKRPGRQ